MSKKKIKCFDDVKKFIECLNAFYPTYEQVEFIKKYKNAILEDDYYRALVNESIFERQITEEYYREFEKMKPIVIIDDGPDFQKIGKFIISQAGKISNIQNAVESFFTLNQLTLAPTRDGNDFVEDDIYVQYFSEIEALNIQSVEEYDFIVKVNDKEITPDYDGIDDQTNMNSYVVYGIQENDDIEIYIDD